MKDALKYDHLNGPETPIECPDVKEIEEIVPIEYIPKREKIVNE